MDLKFSSDAKFVPHIHGQIDGVGMDFTLDLGSNGLIRLSKQSYENLLRSGAVKDKDTKSSSENIGLGGILKDREGKFQRGELLDRPLKDWEVDSGGDLNFVGLAFLVNYNLIIDFEHAKLFYQVRACDPPVNVSGMLGAAILFAKGEGLVYKLQAEGGAAREAGLTVGDRMVRFGDLMDGDFNARALYELCLQHAGENLKVEVVHEEGPGMQQTLQKQIRVGPKAYWFPRADAH